MGAARQACSLTVSLGLHLTVALLAARVGRARLPVAPAAPLRPDAWIGVGVEVGRESAQAGLDRSAPATPPAAENALSPVSPSPGQQAGSMTALPGRSAAVQRPLGGAVRNRLRPRPTPRSASARPASAERGASADTADAGSGSYGSRGLPPGVRSLPGAFTRAIPPAVSADSTWSERPVGPAGAVSIAIEIDAEGHIEGSELVVPRSSREPPAELRRLCQRVVLLLGGGQFALSRGAGPGRELLRVEIELSDRAASSDGDPRHVVDLGFEAPFAGKPGRAHFTLASGRHFEAKVTALGR